MPAAPRARSPVQREGDRHDDPRGDLWGLTTMTGLSTSQLISLVVAAGSIVFMIMRLRRVPAAAAVSSE